MGDGWGWGAYGKSRKKFLEKKFGKGDRRVWGVVSASLIGGGLITSIIEIIPS